MDIEANENSHLEALSSGKTKYKFNHPNHLILESFPSPFMDKTLNPNVATGEVVIACPEFTSICPITGQPDYATIHIKYIPRNSCLESKSLKLYLNQYRNYGIFHEACVTRIINDLIDLLDPWQMSIIGAFAPRGGIPFHPTVRYVRKED